MTPRISFITLAVTDLKRSYAFYSNALGFPSRGILPGNEDHVLFNLANGFGLVLYATKEFVKGTENPERPVVSSGFILSHIADSKEDVDKILSSALKAGARKIGNTHDEPWGYSANFADPDGHQWEITFMPGYTT